MSGGWILEKVDGKGRVWYLRVLTGRREHVHDWAHCPVMATVFASHESSANLTRRVRARASRMAAYRGVRPDVALTEWVARNERGRRQAAAAAEAAGTAIEVGGPASDAGPLVGPGGGGQPGPDPV